MLLGHCLLAGGQFFYGRGHRCRVSQRGDVYLQSENGHVVKRDMPQLVGAEVEALYAKGKSWLAGKPLR